MGLRRRPARLQRGATARTNQVLREMPDAVAAASARAFSESGSRSVVRLVGPPRRRRCGLFPALVSQMTPPRQRGLRDDELDVAAAQPHVHRPGGEVACDFARGLRESFEQDEACGGFKGGGEAVGEVLRFRTPCRGGREELPLELLDVMTDLHERRRRHHNGVIATPMRDVTGCTGAPAPPCGWRSRFWRRWVRAGFGTAAPRGKGAGVSSPRREHRLRLRVARPDWRAALSQVTGTGDREERLWSLRARSTSGRSSRSRPRSEQRGSMHKRHPGANVCSPPPPSACSFPRDPQEAGGRAWRPTKCQWPVPRRRAARQPGRATRSPDGDVRAARAQTQLPFPLGGRRSEHRTVAQRL